QAASLSPPLWGRCRQAERVFIGDTPAACGEYEGQPFYALTEREKKEPHLAKAALPFYLCFDRRSDAPPAAGACRRAQNWIETCLPSRFPAAPFSVFPARMPRPSCKP